MARSRLRAAATPVLIHDDVTDDVRGVPVVVNVQNTSQLALHQEARWWHRGKVLENVAILAEVIWRWSSLRTRSWP